MHLSTLREIGLTPGESKVYLALLGLGLSTTGPIVKKSGVTTSKSYKILDRLEEKGLASHVIKNKVKHFKAAPPERILDIIEKQQEELTQKRKEVQDILPQLIAYQKEIQEEHEAEIYTGMAGLDTVFTQQLRDLDSGENLYVIGITHYEEYPKEVAEYFRRLEHRRDNKGVVSNFLLGEGAKGSFDYMDSPLVKIRYIPYASPVSVNIHKNTTVIGIFIGTPILFKIDSKIIAENFIQYFKMLWEQAKE